MQSGGWRELGHIPGANTEEQAGPWIDVAEQAFRTARDRLILRLHRPHINLIPLRNPNSKVRIRDKFPSKNNRISFPRSDMFFRFFRCVLTIREKL